jgi:hypothetical protein
LILPGLKLRGLADQRVVEDRYSFPASLTVVRYGARTVQHTWAGYADDKDLVPRELLLVDQHVQRPDVARPGDDCDLGRDILAPCRHDQVAQVDDQIVMAALIPYQPVSVTFVVDKSRPEASFGTSLVADDAAHFAQAK